ncbi:MAG TPA: sialate O-acetylesterase, partial [Planctomycetaceae bacterium]|nr:sialate O-acetylesterase [Planctomycetaceae bacterium]
AGEDKTFVDAQAKVDGDSIVVSASGVEKPVAVRFAWNQIADPNLTNTEGLPASAFRTDKW